MQKKKKFLYVYIVNYLYICFFFFSFFLFGATPTAYGSSQAKGWIGATAAGLHHSHSNAGTEPCLLLTPQLKAMMDPHWVKLGIEPTSSWILVKFASAVPQWELPIFSHNHKYSTIRKHKLHHMLNTKY